MKNGIIEPTCGYQDCHTSQISTFGGYVEMKEYLHTWAIINVNTIQNIFIPRWFYLGMKVLSWYIDPHGMINKIIVKHPDHIGIKICEILIVKKLKKKQQQQQQQLIVVQHRCLQKVLHWRGGNATNILYFENDYLLFWLWNWHWVIFQLVQWFVVIKAPSSKMNDFTKTPQTPSMWTIYTSFTSPIAML